MKNDQQKGTDLVEPISFVLDNLDGASRTTFYDRQITSVESEPLQTTTEEYRRSLLEQDMSNAHDRGFWVCRLWQFLLTLNVTIVLTIIVLILLLLFIIGPLSPYQTYGQSCRALSCNYAQGLACSSASICVCPSSDSYWSRNETGCRRCPKNWSMVNGKCVFISTFSLNWTDSFAYCRSFTAQLLTFSKSNLFDLHYFVSSNGNYFIGLTEQPHNSNQWQWVDGSTMSSASLHDLFCANGTMNRFDPDLRTYMNCGIFRADACLARYACQRTDANFICEKI